jgi:hypothetical protein
MYTGLINNIYHDFLREYRDTLKDICETQRCPEAVILIDLDKYTDGESIRKSIFRCTKCKLPDYAQSKLEKFTNLNNHIVMKHFGLCLVSEI